MAKEHAYVPPNEMPPRPIQPVLVGQKALVTGGSKGIGEGIALSLAQAGLGIDCPNQHLGLSTSGSGNNRRCRPMA